MANQPKIVFLGINSIGETIYEWLSDRDDNTILALLTTKQQLKTLEALSPELIISAGYRHIIPGEILDIPELGCVNLHKSFLPVNRGANPNVWSIIESNPAGVSLHFISEEIDEGPVIDRRKVPIYPDDSGKTLYDRLEAAQFQQFKETWPAIRDCDTKATPQTELPEEPTYHYKKDFVNLWELDLEAHERVEDIIDRLRALTFPPYKNAYFEKNGKRYYVEIDITPATEVETISADDGEYSNNE